MSAYGKNDLLTSCKVKRGRMVIDSIRFESLQVSFHIYGYRVHDLFIHSLKLVDCSGAYRIANVQNCKGYFILHTLQFSKLKESIED